MKHKTFRTKMDLGTGEGQVEAVFATLGVIDHDGDVTLPGAFMDGQQAVLEPWNHNWQSPPVGVGSIVVEGSEAKFNGQFFMNMQAGREHYEAVKGLGPLQEWSYTFNILDAEPGMIDGRAVQFLKKMDVIGVGPVTRGAGMNTRTVAVKGQGGGNGDGDGEAPDTAEQAAPGSKPGADDSPSGAGALLLLELQIMEELGESDDEDLG